MRRIKKKRSNKKKIILLIMIPILVLLIFLSPYLFINIKLIGSRKINLDYGEKYSEPGYKAYIFRKNITDNIKVKKNIKTDIGTYKVIYN